MFKEGTNEATVKGISKKLTEGYTHHNYLIEYNEAKNLGLKVNRPFPELLSSIDELYQIQLRIGELIAIDAKLKGL